MSKKSKIVFLITLLLLLILTVSITKFFYPYIKYDEYEYYVADDYEYEYLTYNEERYIRCDRNDNFDIRFEVAEPVGYYKPDFLTALIANCKIYAVDNDSNNNVLFINTVIDHGFYFMKEGISFEDIFKSSNITVPNDITSIYIDQDDLDYDAKLIKDKSYISEFYSKVETLQNPIEIAVENLTLVKEFEIEFENCYVYKIITLKTDANSNYYLLENNPFNECETVYLLSNETAEYFLNFKNE